MYRTQKARGLGSGWAISAFSGYGYKVPGVHGVWPHTSEFKDDIFKGNVFARPCPLQPRHGFVESRSVKSREELDRVIKETLDAEPDGEVIVMDRLTGRYSAIMTRSGVTWGKGNDGVTSGHGEQLVIPTPPGKFDDKVLPYLGYKVGSPEGVYVELVEDKGHVCVVQVRLGPKQPDSGTKRVMAASAPNIYVILTPQSDDLMDWAQVLRKVQAPKGALVHLPGQSLSSHFAVQAIAAGFNVSVEAECPVKVGRVLTADTSAMAPLTDKDYAVLACHLKEMRETQFWDFPRDVLLCIATLHSLPFWGGEEHLLKLRARGVIAAARYGLAAVLGESRHKQRFLKHDDGLLPATPDIRVPWKKILGHNVSSFRPSRGYVFIKALGLPWRSGPGLAKAAAEDMRLKGQPKADEYVKCGGHIMDGKYGASFMGMRWEWAALKVHDIFVAVNRFINSPNADNWGVILGVYNEIICASHNGGYLLSKWVGAEIIDTVATSPCLAFGYRAVMETIWGGPHMKPTFVWLPVEMAPKGIEKTHKMNHHGNLVPKEFHSYNFGLVDYKDLGKKCLDAGLTVYLKDEFMSIAPDPENMEGPENFEEALLEVKKFPKKEDVAEEEFENEEPEPMAIFDLDCETEDKI